jgi:hypothetical protein
VSIAPQESALDNHPADDKPQRPRADRHRVVPVLDVQLAADLRRTDLRAEFQRIAPPRPDRRIQGEPLRVADTLFPRRGLDGSPNPSPCRMDFQPVQDMFGAPSYMPFCPAGAIPSA